MLNTLENEVKDYLVLSYERYVLTPKGYKLLNKIQSLFPKKKVKEYQLNIVDYSKPFYSDYYYKIKGNETIRKNFLKDTKELEYSGKALRIKPVGFNTSYLLRLYKPSM